VHSLNLAVAFQVLDNIKNGLQRSCLAMGFEEKDLQILIDPESIGALVDLPVLRYRVVLDGTVVHRLSARARDKDEEDMIRRAIVLGASTPMITKLFGLQAKEIAVWRDILGVPYRRGRWPKAAPEYDAILWEHWVRLTKEQDINLRKVRSFLAIAMQMTECEPALNLPMVWGIIKCWITQGQVDSPEDLYAF